jgi:hypothetical protein
MATIKDYGNNQNNDKKKVVKVGKLKDKSFGQKVRDAFISEEVHDVKSYVVFDVIIPAVKETFRNLIVNSLDMSLFGKVRNNRNVDQRGGSTYIAYDRAYGGGNNHEPRPQRNGTAPLRVNELNRIVFDDKNDALEVLNYLLENLEEYHVASVADMVGASGFQISPIHHKWGWYDLNGARVDELPDGGFIVTLPKPGPI